MTATTFNPLAAARALEAADVERAREQDQRHAEAMTALRELITRTGKAAD